MSLRDEAAAFTRAILEDTTTGFAQAITVWDPSGNKLELKGFANWINQALDVQTGVMVSAQLTTVTFPIAAFPRGLPEGINDPKSEPWVVAFADLAGVVSRFKVRETNPDRTLGVILCILEEWDG